MRGTGLATFAAILLLIAGALGVIFGGANRWPSLAIFLLCVWVVYAIVVLGDDERELRT